MKVLVCDDLPGRGEEIVKEISDAEQKSVEIQKIFGNDLTQELTKLFKNVAAVLNTNGDVGVLEPTRFDDVDIVILDNNLAQLKIEGARLSAESVAGYVRAFTAAPYIISLNKNPEIDFDLRYLIGDYASRADLALNTKHLSNPALWTGERKDAENGFRPWYWPKLLEVAARRRVQIKFISDCLQNPILTTFGFDREAVDFLSRHARGVLSPAAELDGATDPGGISLDAVTFLDLFMASSRSIPASSERKILGDQALAEKNDGKKIISRVVAAEIDHWFRRDVLGPQEFLVDVPHLLMRMPFLLDERANDIGQWNLAIDAGDTPPFGIDGAMFDNHIKDTKFDHDQWVQSPCFSWPKIKADEKLNEKFFATDSDWADAVFCEDRSSFFPRSDADTDLAPLEFAAEFEGSWNRRYVTTLDGIRYAPKSRFAV